MRRLIALAGAAVGLPVSGCSAPPTAHRADRTEETAVTAPTVAPDSRPGSDGGPTTSTTGPAPTTTEAPVMTPAVVTIEKLPPDTMGSTTTTVRTRPVPVVTVPEKAHDDESDDEWSDREAILACIRSYEGDYGTAAGNGYWGAYQFRQSTWDGAVAAAGYPQWVGRRASDAPPHVQDDAAWSLYLSQGFGPWPPASRYCRGVA